MARRSCIWEVWNDDGQTFISIGRSRAKMPDTIALVVLLLFADRNTFWAGWTYVIVHCKASTLYPNSSSPWTFSRRMKWIKCKLKGPVPNPSDQLEEVELCYQRTDDGKFDWHKMRKNMTEMSIHASQQQMYRELEPTGFPCWHHESADRL